jgi:exodeoxyribonuclease V gamma subunit
MNHLNVITSNSLSMLAKRLAADTHGSAGSIFTPETIVVQSTGMARWVSMELACLNGVCANVAYKFPNNLLEDCFQAVIPNLPSPSPYSPEIMTWRIMALLPEMQRHPGFEPIRRYLGGIADDRGLLQLSRKIADTFDQYTLFRPEMVLEWDQGKGDGWQPELWRALAAPHPRRHRAALLRTFRESITSRNIPDGMLPARISLFGISYLPPFHLEQLSLLARVSQVTIYLLNPCGDYWGDIVSRKKLAGMALRQLLPAGALEYYETGNPLLSSLGTMGQEFFNMLLDIGAVSESLDDVAPKIPSTMLNTVQADILHLRDRSGPDGEKCQLSSQDRSIQVHSCHSPQREMEVLYDNLLRMFEELPDLEPRQIVVMTPDLENYAPYISAVFGAHGNDRPPIPFTIADRSLRREAPVIDTFLRILELPSSRFGINQIMDLLEAPAVMARFAISNDELETMRNWLQTTDVRWGRDAGHRAALGFPSFAENSWQAAIDRMLLGYALEADNDRLFNDILPFDGIEGRQALPLGKLAGFFQSAADASTRLANARTLPEWADTLTIVTENLLAPTEDPGDLKVIHEAIQQLRNICETSGYVRSIGLDALRDYLTTQLDQPGVSYGFLGGRVTFCAMLPMRSIPFRVICLAGMNDSVFPRISRQPGFSLMSGPRRCGDRSLREEDRYLFLEALMSAEERLFISYTGQSNRDNSEIPPSVVVSELLDCIDAGFTVPVEEAPRILTKHRLQAFSPAYYTDNDDNRFFSYSTLNCRALETRRTTGSRPLPFIIEPLPELDDSWRDVDLQRLVRFFANPAAQFLSQRLGIRPGRPDAEAEERESFNLDALGGYGLRQELVQRLLDGRDTASLFPAARSASRLPPLAAGRAAFERAEAEAGAFARLVAPRLGEVLEPISVNLELGGFRITGRMTNIQRERHLRYRCATMKGKDRLSLWIEHLVLNCLADEGYPRDSLLICRDSAMSLPPSKDAATILLDLLECYREGLRRPLPFFPDSSWLFLEKGPAEAERRWSGSAFSTIPPESADPAFTLCFGRLNPLDQDFRLLAQRIYAPLRAAAVEKV